MKKLNILFCIIITIVVSSTINAFKDFTPYFQGNGRDAHGQNIIHRFAEECESLELFEKAKNDFMSKHWNDTETITIRVTVDSSVGEFAQEDESSLNELRALLSRLEHELVAAETETLLAGENDARNAICTIHPGAGGTESQDWAEMLLRMYLKWAERRGFKTEIIDYQPGEEAGIKSATFKVEGEYAYGLLAAEAGVHRLVRISPFDQNARRHTSFASLFVYPEIDEAVEVEINDKDLRVDTYRSTGAGGQHINTTDSAVRITHLPTNIVVQCQNQRSQHQNRAVAMQVLRSRLYELELEKRRAETKELEANKQDISFGSQIRNYVLAPYRLVKDARTKLERGDVDSVLDGDIDEFIKEYLLSRRAT